MPCISHVLWYDVIITMNDLKGVMDMSTLEKTINLLNDLPENEVEIIYSYVRFISSQHEERKKATESIEDIFNNIVGVLPDTGKTAKQYHDERIAEKYENID